MKLIRKISIGNNLKDAMHYQVGTIVFGGKKISDILLEDGFFDIYTELDGVKEVWKSFNKSSVSHIEYYTN